MNWLKKLFDATGGELVEKIGSTIANISEKHLGKKELNLALNQLVADYSKSQVELVASELQAKERVMVAELQQGDNYTKRARPTIIYVGLVGAIVDAIGYIDFTMPGDFWYVWGGVAGTYVLSRGVEKAKVNGVAGKVAGWVTGRKTSFLAD